MLDAATIADSRQELRLHPSTHKTGTIGGYVAGGSSGIGSITWGLLRDRGNILMARVVTMEAEPRILELRGADIQKVNHAYGTNGVITELELPLAPAYRWAELLVALPDLGDRRPLRRRARARGRDPEEAGLRDRRAGGRTTSCSPSGWRAGEHALIVMVADFALDALHDALRAWPARIAYQGFVDDVAAPQQPLFEYTWNHTTLHALKHDRTVTYLQTLFPPPRHLDKVAEMAAEFGDEVPMHLEFVRFGGEIACFGLQLVRYTTRRAAARDHRRAQPQRLPDLQPARLHARGRRDEEGRPGAAGLQARGRPARAAQPRQDDRLGRPGLTTRAPTAHSSTPAAEPRPRQGRMANARAGKPKPLRPSAR